jgi:hypothetical protein
MPSSMPVKGTRPRIRIRFRDTDNAGVDPTTLYFKFQDTEFNETVYTYGIGAQIVRDALGDYHCDLPVTLPDRFDKGKYFCRWEALDASGIALAAAEVVLEVNTRYPTKATI